MKDRGRVWAGHCEPGSFSGFPISADLAIWADDEISGYKIIDVEVCGVPGERIIRGHVKAI